VVEIADREGRTPGEIAIAWVLKNAAVTGAIVGIRTPEQVAGIAGGLGYRLDAATAAELDRFLGDFA
jgi:aryl-alcohol dehydrogenase-like predicted oxidoreductase